MMSSSTEVTPSKILSDTPLYQRTSKASEIVRKGISGVTLELGCGEGYGMSKYIKQIHLL